jgi:1,3-beta-glucan synthase
MVSNDSWRRPSRLIKILATLAELSYIPTTWNNTSHLARRFLFLPVTLALTAGPTFYIAFVENQSDGGGSLGLLGIPQLFISVVVTRLFGMLPSDWISGYVSPAVVTHSQTVILSRTL